MALDGVSWVWRGLVEIAVSRLKSAACFRIGAVIHSLPRAALRSGACLGLLSPSALILRGFQFGAMPKHGVHDDSKTARERDPRLTHRGALRDGERPVLQFQWRFVAREHDVGSLVEQRA